MPANVEQLAYFCATPWHGLGIPLDHVFTAAEGIILGGLNWTVNLEECQTVSGLSLPRTRAVIRSSDKRLLGVVSDSYKPLQNTSAFTFFDKIVGEGKAIYHTIGSLAGGRKIWLLAKLPGTIKVTGNDVVNKFVLFANSHDGSMAVRGGFTGVRVVCQNTLQMALGEIVSGFTINHRGNFDYQFEQAIKGMGFANTYFEQMEAAFGQLVKVSINDIMLDKYIEGVFPLPKKELIKHIGEEKWQTIYNYRASMQEMTKEKMETGAGLKLPGVYGTMWSSYNAVVETVDWDFKKPNARHLHSVWFGEGSQVKKKALSQALALSKS